MTWINKGLARLGRAWFRRYPTRANQRFACKYFRRWCCDEEMVVETREGFRMGASPHDYASYRIYFFGEYDAGMTGFIKAHAGEGMTCWDVGTERGWFSLLLGRLVGPQGRVDSFEAFPGTCEKLRYNLGLNGFSWVTLYPAAVSDREGSQFFVPPAKVDQFAGFISDCSGLGYLTQEGGPGRIEVPTITLDAHAKQTRVERLDFIKMDIEGAEVAALRGARETIMRFRPVIAVEYNRSTARRGGTSVEELDELLESYGYDRFTYGLEGLKKIRLEQWRDWPDEDVVFNAYCLPRR
jgi:FkbM family methyltransferase